MIRKDVTSQSSGCLNYVSGHSKPTRILELENSSVCYIIPQRRPRSIPVPDARRPVPSPIAVNPPTPSVRSPSMDANPHFPISVDRSRSVDSVSVDTEHLQPRPRCLRRPPDTESGSLHSWSCLCNSCGSVCLSNIFLVIATV